MDMVEYDDLLHLTIGVMNGGVKNRHSHPQQSTKQVGAQNTVQIVTTTNVLTGDPSLWSKNGHCV
jgi:hypothetical protein